MNNQPLIEELRHVPEPTPDLDLFGQPIRELPLPEPEAPEKEEYVFWDPRQLLLWPEFRRPLRKDRRSRQEVPASPSDIDDEYACIPELYDFCPQSCRPPLDELCS